MRLNWILGLFCPFWCSDLVEVVRLYFPWKSWKEKSDERRLPYARNQINRVDPSFLELLVPPSHCTSHIQSFEHIIPSSSSIMDLFGPFIPCNNLSMLTYLPKNEDLTSFALHEWKINLKIVINLSLHFRSKNKLRTTSMWYCSHYNPFQYLW